jgi:YkoY family integral membrane protein
MALPLPFSSTEVALLPGLMVLETILSADNALVLASLVQPLETEAERERVLNRGLATAILLRVLAIAAAGSLLRHPAVRVLGGGYLVWLALNHFRAEFGRAGGANGHALEAPAPLASGSLSGFAMVMVLATTNLAFSIDSLCAALALTDNLALVMVAGTAGVVVLRGVTGWVLRWMRRWPDLVHAGYLTVLAVGLRLLAEQVTPALAPPEPVMLGAMAVLFGWALSRPREAES